MNRSDGKFSVFVSETLDVIGYSSSMIKYRREMMAKIYGDQIHTHALGLHRILAGSKGEGITRLMESDVDLMVFAKNVFCVDDATQCYPRQREVIQMDRRNSAPGYTRLSPLYDNGDLMMSNEGLEYLPNSVLETIMKEMTYPRISGRQGPSVNLTTVEGLPCDYVLSISCQCPEILTSWLTRLRTQDWPTWETFEKVSTLDAHVVPVGSKRSYEQELEWRICYTLAELTLVKSFNDTQTKVYILLKFLAKSVLKPVCSGMTSYVMKNTILWLSELTQTSRFTPDLLVDRLVRSLRLLSIFIAEGCLPSYMIPERNLLSGNIRPGEKKRLLSVLSDLMSEGGSMLLRCDKLKMAMLKMYTSPDETKADGERNANFEWLVIQFDTIVSNLGYADTTCGSFEELRNDFCLFLESKQPEELIVLSKILQEQLALILPDKLYLLCRGKNIEHVYIKRYLNLLSQLS